MFSERRSRLYVEAGFFGHCPSKRAHRGRTADTAHAGSARSPRARRHGRLLHASDESIDRSLCGKFLAATRVLADSTSQEARHGATDLTVVAFTDFRCPVCRKADPAMRRAVTCEGNVRLLYKDWPTFGAQSVRAAEVALAADRQEIYPSVHHALMRMEVDEESMRHAVEQAGRSWRQREADLVRHRPMIARQLDKNRLQAFALGLEGTPAYLIGHFLAEGGLSEREFRRAFVQARAKSH